MAQKRPYILGIDPGASGALAVFSPVANKVIKVWDFPLSVCNTKGKKVIDPYALALQLEEFSDMIAFAVVEDVHAMPGQGVTSMFSFGVSKGLVLGVLAANLCPCFNVPPAVWKGCYGLSKNKADSITLCLEKYPEMAQMLARKKDDGRAEAILLAEFGKRFY